MYEILTDDADLARSDLGDRTHYFVEQVSGRRQPPVEGASASVACWGDTELVREAPSRAAVAADGTRATPDAEGHHWGTVCPTDPEYREALIERIERVGSDHDVRLTTLGFPGDAFCRCDDCEMRYSRWAVDGADADPRDGPDSGSDRDEWRTRVLTAFVADAAERVDGELIATLYPDPYPGNLRERAGLDPASLADHVDAFLVPLCSPGYRTVYWVESIARGFARELRTLDVSLQIQLSGADVDPERLTDVTRIVEPFADAIVYGTHPEDRETVQETIERCRAPASTTARAR